MNPFQGHGVQQVGNLVVDVKEEGKGFQTFALLWKQRASLVRAGILSDSLTEFSGVENTENPVLENPVLEILRRIHGGNEQTRFFSSVTMAETCDCGEEHVHIRYMVYPFDFRSSSCPKCNIIFVRYWGFRALPRIPDEALALPQLNLTPWVEEEPLGDEEKP